MCSLDFLTVIDTSLAKVKNNILKLHSNCLSHEARCRATTKGELATAANRPRVEAISAPTALSSTKLELSNNEIMIKGLTRNLKRSRTICEVMKKGPRKLLRNSRKTKEKLKKKDDELRTANEQVIL